MTSQINYSTIDINFPVAGQDNDSQGFRDNFAKLRNGLATAQSEISTLQSNSVDITKSNSLGGNVLENMVLKKAGFKSYPASSIANTGTTNVIPFDIHYRRYALPGTAVFTVSEFPLDSMSSVFLELKSDSTTLSRQAQFAIDTTNPNIGTQTPYIYRGTGFNGETFLAIEPNFYYLVEISSPDGGVTVYVRLVDKFTRATS